jgi:hypothetical protein
MSSSSDPPAKNTRRAHARRLEKRKEKLALPSEEQPIIEPSEAEVHSEAPAEISQLSPITELRSLEERSIPQRPDDAESETIRDIPDEHHYEPEQSFTTAPLISAPPGGATSSDPHIGMSVGRSLTPEITRDKGKQRAIYEHTFAVEYGSPQIRGKAAISRDVQKCIEMADDTARELESQRAERQLLDERSAITYNRTNTMKYMFLSLQSELNQFNPASASEDAPSTSLRTPVIHDERGYHESTADPEVHHDTQGSPTPMIKVEERDLSELPPTPQATHSDRADRARLRWDQLNDRIARSQARGRAQMSRGRGMPPP